jgi:hypothetical protein
MAAIAIAKRKELMLLASFVKDRGRSIKDVRMEIRMNTIKYQGILNADCFF